MSRPTAAIIGASTHRHKFGNRAVRAFATQGYEVFPVHPSAPSIEGHKAYRSILDVPAAELDIISIYVPPEVGLQLIDDLAKKPAKEVWLNPGADSDAVVEKAKALGLNVVQACSIVGVGMSPHELD